MNNRDVLVSPLLQSFFLQRLMQQKGASPHTVQSYSETFQLLFKFVVQELRVHPSDLKLSQLSADFISAFLKDLEYTRHVSVRTRNQRLAGIRSFFRFLSLKVPALSGTIQQVLAIPTKRCSRTLVPFLSTPEIEALLSAPDRKAWIGRRDYALLMLAVRTGLRLSELTGLRIDSISLDRGANVRCLGKGRRERIVPLTKETVVVLREWCREPRADRVTALFPTGRGTSLSSDAVQRLVRRYATAATRVCPSLGRKRVTPHVLRHTTAMEMIAAGVDIGNIALCLGHRSPETTQIYIDSYLPLMEAAMAKVQSPGRDRLVRYRPPDKLLGFLKSL